MFLSNKHGLPIAVIKPDKKIKKKKKDIDKKKELLYISEDKDDSMNASIEQIREKDLRIKINENDYNELMNALKTGIPPSRANAKILFTEAKTILEKKKGKEIYKPDCIFQPIPNMKFRECIYACGPSGSGKSCYVASYAMNYTKLFPENRIYLLSRLDEDESIDIIPNLLRIKITEEIVDYEIKPDELSNSLVIFDDIDTIPNPKVKKFVENLLDDLLQTGRHANTYVAVTTHLLYNGQKSRMLLNEIHCATIFPGRSTRHSIDRLLTLYFGLTRNQVSEICKLPSRWLTVYKSPPMVIYEKGAMILNQ